MGGFVSPISEPGPDAAPGSVFRAIPASGSLTDYDDTLLGGALTNGTVLGGLGDDLIVLNYSSLTQAVSANAALGYAFVPFTTFDTLSFWEFERFQISGGAGNDTLQGSWLGATTLRGGLGDDLLTVHGSGNSVSGGAGNDTIIGATQDTTLSGGTGTDLVIVDLSASSAGVDLGAGFNSLNWTGIEQFGGTLTAFDDTLRGGALLIDSNGGAGVDLVQLDYSGLATSISFWAASAGFATVSFQEPVGETLNVFLTGFENFDIRATAQGDFLTGGSGNDLFFGLDGDDTLQGVGGRDTLIGGAGNDYITGNLDMGSSISGGAGDDTINVWRMDDTVSGGSGFDRLQLNMWDYDRRAVIDLVAGVPGWTGIESVTGSLSRQNDVFRTTTLDGSISGEDGTDLLAFDYSRSGADRIEFIWGGLRVMSGDNSRFISAASFERYDLRGSQGNDDLTGDMLADTLDGGRGNDRLDGGAGRDVLFGGIGSDTLFGGDANDTLDGGAGRDTLVGGAGNDVLTGGAGRDTFYFWGPSIGNDRITDFEAGVDRIVIDPVFEMVPVTQSGADVLIDIMGQTIRVENATTTEVQQAIVYDYLFLI